MRRKPLTSAERSRIYRSRRKIKLDAIKEAGYELVSVALTKDEIRVISDHAKCKDGHFSLSFREVYGLHCEKVDLGPKSVDCKPVMSKAVFLID